MRNIIKIIEYVFKKFDISPFSKGNVLKLFLYMFTGICFIIFTDNNIETNQCFYKDQNGKTICNPTNNFHYDNLIIEKFDLVNPRGFIIFSSQNILNVISEPKTLYSGRSPPIV